MSSTSFVIVPWSEATDGFPIAVTATSAGTADLLHTCTNTGDEYDEVYVWAVNSGTVEATLYIIADNGSSTRTFSRYDMKPGVGKVLMVDGVRFSGGMEIQAWVSSNVGITAVGNVNRGTNQ